jgi:large subunit ribosomal protein L23
MELSQVLLSPVVTEKSTHAQTTGKYTFLVNLNANKIEVARAIKSAYGVDVKAVRIVNVLSKSRIAGRGKTFTKRSAAKKAIVTLAPKQSLDVNKFSKASK